MEYITFIEYNHLHREKYIFYLQYTGNEKALNKLSDMTRLVPQHQLDDYTAVFDIDIANRMPIESLDFRRILGAAHVETVDGRFEFDMELTDGMEIADKLHDMFVCHKIVQYFKRNDISTE